MFEQNILGGCSFFILKDMMFDFVKMNKVFELIKFNYLKFDNKLSFDKFLLVYLVNMYYDED